MRKNKAVLSVLLAVLFCCPPETVAIAMEDKKPLVDEELPLPEKDESVFADRALPGKDEGLFTDQALPEKDKDSYADQASLDNGSSLIDQLWKETADGKEENEDLQKGKENETQREAEGGETKTGDTQASALRNLQIPQKLEVVIDPWEMEGNGQVYSEEYIICNTGDTPGVLTLSNLACRPRKQSKVVVKTDKDGVHDGNDKNIYMEMLFGNGERIIFSSEKSLYQTELNPGEELSVCFSGEVNENASVQWMDQDVSISVTYSWEAEDEMESLEEGQINISDKDEVDRSQGQQQTNAGKGPADHQPNDTGEDMTADAQQNQNDANGKEQEDTSESAPSTDDAENEQNADTGEEKRDSSTDVNDANEKEQETAYGTEEDQTDGGSETDEEDWQADRGTVSPDETEKEEMKNIDLQEPQKTNVNIDSWKTDEKGRIVSKQYLLYNAGDTAGTLTLSELICKPQESGGVKILTDKKSLSDSGDKSVCMELTLGNGEKAVLSQESSIYEVNLEPGEKLEVRFIGETKGNLFENRKEGDIAVTAVCTWDIE